MERLKGAVFWVRSLGCIWWAITKDTSDTPRFLGRVILVFSMLWGVLLIGEPMGFWIIQPKTHAWVLADPGMASDMQTLTSRLAGLQKRRKDLVLTPERLPEHPEARVWRLTVRGALQPRGRMALERPLVEGLQGVRVLWQEPAPLLGFDGPTAARRFLAVAFAWVASLGFLYAVLLAPGLERTRPLWNVWFWHGLGPSRLKILMGGHLVATGLRDSLLAGAASAWLAFWFKLVALRDFLVVGGAWVALVVGLSGLILVRRFMRKILEDSCAA
jgi:hypothetical protein